MKSSLLSYIRSIGLHRNRRVATLAISSFLGLYAAYVSYVMTSAPKVSLKGVDEIFGLTSMVLGILFGSFSAFIMSQWWSLRLCTGGVSGSISDIAMVLRSYFASVEVPLQARQSLANNLKLAHLFHLSDVSGVSDPVSFVEALVPSISPQTTSLIKCLSDILRQVTDLTNDLPFSDAVKFSVLPSVQANLSSIRSCSGDCSMILNTRYPRALAQFVLLFTTLHLMYLPYFLGTKTGWDFTSVMVGSSLGFSFIGGFVWILFHYFWNPFLVNGFRLERIVSSTFAVVDECLLEPQSDTTTKGQKTSRSARR